MEWTLVERPGYVGKRRDELAAKWDEQFGKGNWRLSWQWGEQIIERPLALQIYEDGYYEFLRRDGKVLDWLVSTASEIYDTAESNVAAGFDYDVQETPSNHLHDVAIRRAVLRLGTRFMGDQLVRVRSGDPEGAVLSPSNVPFHLPSMIYRGEIQNYRGKPFWWKPNSIEDFYQRNKVLEARS